jgi:mRNA interferase MazF
MKDYSRWMPVKANLNNIPKRPTFHEGDVLWVCVGENVGFEQDGKGNLFARPVVVIVKYNKELFLGVPLTSKPKEGRYYYQFDLRGKISSAILSQVRAVDSSRISGKRIGIISHKDLRLLKNKLKELIH